VLCLCVDVKGGGGIFKDMAVHDLDMARFLMGSEPVKVLATGSCQIDKAIEDLEGPEAFDTATVIVRFENGKDAIIDVCRQAKYGYDQRAEVLGMEGMVLSENMQPSTVRKFTGEFVGQADMPCTRAAPDRTRSTATRVRDAARRRGATCPRNAPLSVARLGSRWGRGADDFFMSRYKVAYDLETNAFIDALLENRPAPCSGRDGLVALVMAMAAGRSAMEQRWVDFGEVRGMT
jgi:myo-inositol 2-dehydrogenase/D-chiro-inositol 1-dehydrogenase